MNEREGFRLVWATGISVALHLLMFVASWLFVFRAAAPRSAVPEETVLRFTFAPATADRDAAPRGDVPLPAPGPRRQPIARAEAPEAPAVGGAEAEAARPPSASAPAGGQERAAGADLPQGGPLAAGREEAPARRTPEPPRSFDMESALQSFGRALGHSQPSNGGSGQGLAIPDLPPLPATGFGFGNLEFESRDYDWTDYARQIYVAIWRAWHSRLYATTDAFDRWGYERSSWWLHHASRIAFTIESNGQVTGIVLETPAGCYPLDDSALDALREVVLPPLPAEFPRDRETIHARFIADGDIRGMRSHLGELKRLGLF